MMKKLLLSTISAVALTTTATSVVNIKNGTNIMNSDVYLGGTSEVPEVPNKISTLDDKTQENWEWKNIEIKHSKDTSSSGTDTKEETTFDLSATDVSWENVFLKSKELIATGYFALHTYKEPRYFNDILLKLDEDNSKPNYRIWVKEEQNDQWRVLGHQTAKIKLTVIAKYNEETKLVALFIQSYIYARTAGSVHPCSTTSQVNSVRFVDTSQKNNSDKL